MMKLYRNLWRQSFYGYKAAFPYTDAGTWISNVMARPILFVVTFTVTGRFAGHPDAAQAYVIGMAAYSLPTIVFDQMLLGYSGDRDMASVLFGVSGSRLATYLTRGLFNLLNGLAAFLSALTFGWLFLGLDLAPVNWVTFLAATSAMAFAAIGFASFLGPFGLIVRDFLGFTGLMQGAVLVLTGAIIPRSLLPAPLAAVGPFLPLTAGLEAFRAAFRGEGVAAAAELLQRELLVGLSYFAVGYLLLRTFEILARRAGTIAFEGG
jgi:ABC-type polysaccharide/polyol phosphate export permease